MARRLTDAVSRSGCKATEVQQGTYSEYRHDSLVMLLTTQSTNMLAAMPADSTQRTLLERISELGSALEGLSALWTFVSFKTDMLFAATGTGNSSSLKRQPPKQQFEVELGNISQYLLFNNAVVSNMTLFQFGAKRMKAPDKWESPWKENEYPSTELEADDGSHSESAEPEATEDSNASKTITGKGHSVFQLIDHTRTKMGNRMLRSWLRQPLCQLPPIVERQKMIRFLVDNPTLRSTLRDDTQYLKSCPDLEALGMSHLKAYSSIMSR
jgi:hypothetical protein